MIVVDAPRSGLVRVFSRKTALQVLLNLHQRDLGFGTAAFSYGFVIGRNGDNRDDSQWQSLPLTLLE